ncbi:MAG: type II toxin-antitoxin system HicA family toxin [Bryobacteraceae bacterium]
MARSISRRELIRKFRKLGFSGPVSGGRHQFMMRDALKVRIPNPHSGNVIDGSLLSEILRQAGITIREWEEV